MIDLKVKWQFYWFFFVKLLQKVNIINSHLSRPNQSLNWLIWCLIEGLGPVGVMDGVENAEREKEREKNDKLDKR